jgi:hypothetical protein
MERPEAPPLLAREAGMPRKRSRRAGAMGARRSFLRPAKGRLANALAPPGAPFPFRGARKKGRHARRRNIEPGGAALANGVMKLEGRPPELGRA